MLDYQSSLHIQTLVVSIASTSRISWFKKLVVSIASTSRISWFKKLNKNLYVTATSIVSLCLFLNH